MLAKKLISWVEEDAPFGDVTSELLIPSNSQVRAVIVAKSDGVAACFRDISLALEILGLKTRVLVKDGEVFKAGEPVAEFEGPARRILLFERTVLNTMMYLSGVATKTRRLVEIVRKVSKDTRVAATRKIVPGLRELVKKAVVMGGGDTHRFSLSDAILIKDNHIALLGSVEKAIRLAKAKASFIHKIEIEVRKPEDALKAAKLGVDVVMLDNMSVSEVAKAIDLLEKHGVRRKVLVEVSGGIDEDNIVSYAALKPDVISTSSITMRPARVDLSLEVVMR